jgi:hypothetical protein
MGNSQRIGRIEGQYSTFRACTQERGKLETRNQKVETRSQKLEMGKARTGRSEVAGSVLDRVLGKREYAGFFDFFAGEGVAFLTAGG